MQVVGIETCKLGEPADILDGQFAALESDSAFVAELLEHSVDVNRGETESISEGLLRKRKIETAVAHETHKAKPGVQLTEQVGNAPFGATPPDVDDPRPQNGFVDERRPPQRAAEFGAVERQVLHDLVRHVSHARTGKCNDAMIHRAQNGHMQVANVSWNDKGRDLPPAVIQNLVARGPTVEHDVDMVWVVAFADQVTPSGNRANVSAQLGECLDIRLRKSRSST